MTCRLVCCGTTLAFLASFSFVFLASRFFAGFVICRWGCVRPPHEVSFVQRAAQMSGAFVRFGTTLTRFDGLLRRQAVVVVWIRLDLRFVLYAVSLSH